MVLNIQSFAKSFTQAWQLVNLSLLLADSVMAVWFCFGAFYKGRFLCLLIYCYRVLVAKLADERYSSWDITIIYLSVCLFTHQRQTFLRKLFCPHTISKKFSSPHRLTFGKSFFIDTRLYRFLPNCFRTTYVYPEDKWVQRYQKQSTLTKTI